MSNNRTIYALTGHGDIEIFANAHQTLVRVVQLLDAGEEVLVRTWTQHAAGLPWNEGDLR